jgi:hypothetical protein
MTGDEGALAISEIVKHSPALEDFLVFFHKDRL